MPYKRQNKREKLEELNDYDFEGTLDNVISRLSGIKEDYPDHFDFNIEADVETGYYNERYATFTIYALREETDAEMKKRIEKRKAERAKKREEKKKNKGRARR